MNCLLADHPPPKIVSVHREIRNDLCPAVKVAESILQIGDGSTGLDRDLLLLIRVKTDGNDFTRDVKPWSFRAAPFSSHGAAVPPFEISEGRQLPVSIGKAEYILLGMEGHDSVPHRGG